MLSEHAGRTPSPTESRYVVPLADEGHIVISPVDDQGIVRLVGHGAWSVEYMNRHFRELDPVVATARMRMRNVMVLADLRDAPIQSPDVAEMINIGTRRLYRDGDRIAIVVQSSLVKLQMKRIVDCAQVQIFISVAAACTWLMAYS